MNNSKKLMPCIIMLLCFIPGGCSTTIATIRDNPQAFSGKEVTISGTVDTVVTIPLTELSVICFSDNTGNVVVVSNETYKVGQSMVITGTIVAFPSTDEIAEDSQKAINWLRDYLIENNIIDGGFAKMASEVIVKVITDIAGGFNRIFFIVEASR
jgi:DNA/RNA endonuclease YhcR with UshA esterase domain